METLLYLAASGVRISRRVCADSKVSSNYVRLQLAYTTNPRVSGRKSVSTDLVGDDTNI